MKKALCDLCWCTTLTQLQMSQISRVCLWLIAVQKDQISAVWEYACTKAAFKSYPYWAHLWLSGVHYHQGLHFPTLSFPSAMFQLYVPFYSMHPTHPHPHTHKHKQKKPKRHTHGVIGNVQMMPYKFCYPSAHSLLSPSTAQWQSVWKQQQLFTRQIWFFRFCLPGQQWCFDPHHLTPLHPALNVWNAI